MSRPDLYLDGKNDKVLRPKTYFTAAELAELKERMVLQLQCAWRCYVARVRTQKKRDQLEERQRLIDEANQKKKQEAAELKQRNFERRKHPRTVEDFEILYNELESWRYNENKRIKGLGLPKVEEQKELQELLAKETKLLQTIDRLKTIASKENKKLKVQKMLKLMSEPKKWELRTTDVAEVHTPFTTRSKELMELYNGLISRGQTVDSRLEMLLHVKWTVKEFDCTLTRDLVDLIDRESSINSLDLVVKGVCTSATSVVRSSHFLGSDMSFSIFCTLSFLFSLEAIVLSRSMVCSNFVSFANNSCSSFCSSTFGSPRPLIRLFSLYLHDSSSLYKISKSSTVRGCFRRSKLRCFSSAASCFFFWLASSIRRCRSSNWSRFFCVRTRAT
jgi:hypothetical protein